jgi:hypothetical protein
MREKILILIISLVTFLVGVGITSYVLSSGPGGEASIKLAGNEFKIKITEVNFEKLFRDEKYKDEAKMFAKKVFDLNDLDGGLITKLASVSYDCPFSKQLRDMRDRFQGPFNAPDKKVILTFSDNIDTNRAEVCPDSDFYKNRINIALHDLSHMYPVDNADIARPFGCPSPANEPEKIVISKKLGTQLLRTEKLPKHLEAVAKVLPSYVISTK